MRRREVLKGLAVATGAAAVGCNPTQVAVVDPVLEVTALPPGVQTAG